jgi:hypothetical protein
MAHTEPLASVDSESENPQLDRAEREADRLIIEERTMLEDGWVLVRELPEEIRVGRAHIRPGPTTSAGRTNGGPGWEPRNPHQGGNPWPVSSSVIPSSSSAA